MTDNQPILTFVNTFLSNMHPCAVVYNGIEYPSSENAYQAAKTTDAEVKIRIASMSPKQSKVFGRTLTLDDAWDEHKLQVMREVLRCKFLQNSYLRDLLLATGDTHLEEGNWWGDKFWGVSPAASGRGKNFLGVLLMELRSELAGKSPTISYN